MSGTIISDAEKNFIISEIEENINGPASQKGKVVQDDVQHLYADRDNLNSQEALNYASLHGVDPRFAVRTQGFVEKSARISEYQEEQSLECQFDHFISSLESLDLVELFYNHEVNMESNSAKDRLLNTKLPNFAFGLLFSDVKRKNQNLYRLLQQLSLVSGSKNRKKNVKKEKEKRKEKKENPKEKEGKYLPISYSSVLKGRSQGKEKRDSDANTADTGTVDSDDNVTDPKKYKELLASVVAKNIAENSVPSYLATVALLLLLQSEKKSSYNIPVAGLIAALFDKANAADANDSVDAGAENVIPNPFRCFLVNRPVRSKSITNSDVSRYDAVSIMDDNKDEVVSQSGAGMLGPGGPHSDAGSTIGSTIGSTFAELGTETASVLGDEPTEEELLAQALALSMADPTSHAHTQLSIDSSSTMRHHHASRSSSHDHHPAMESVLKGAAPGSVCGESTNSLLFEKLLPPDQLPFIEPLSTFGPFCCKEFWAAMHEHVTPASSTGHHFHSLPVRHVIFALLIAAGYSADQVLGEDSAPYQSSYSAETEDSSSGKSGKRQEELEEKYPHMTTLIPITPSHTVFFLIEYLLDMLVEEIQSHCANPPAGRSGDMDVASAGMRRSLGEDSCSMHSVEDDSEEEWHFQLYFLVWSLMAVLRILRSHLQVAVTNRMSIGSLGLSSMLEKMDPLFSGDTVDSLSGTSPPDPSVMAPPISGPSFVQQLLGKIVDCVALRKDILVTSGLPRSNTVLEGSLQGALTSGFEVDFNDSHTNNMFVLDVAGDESYMDTKDRRVKLTFPYSSYSFFHCMRLAAVETVVSGFTIFFSTTQKRLNLLENYLMSVPVANRSAMADLYECSSVVDLVLHANGVKKLEELSTAAQSSKMPSDAYYQYLLMQKLCLATVQYEGNCGLLSPLSQPTTSAISSLLDKQPRNLKAIGRDIQMQLDRLQSLLFSRLSDPELLTSFLHNQKVNSLSSCLYWGEFLLLRSIQKRVTDNFIAHVGADEHISDISFNVKRCHPNLVISDDYKVISHQGPKLWATVCCTRGFEPNSGKYEWLVRVDRCAKGHVFIGVMAAESSIEKDTYVGMDRYGWGLIGTRSLWHNKSKVVADYGAGFGTGSVVTVRLDTNKGTLSYRSAESDWGVAFENIPKVKIFPAFSLHERDDQLSVLVCSKIAEVSPPAELVRPNVLSQAVFESECNFINYVVTLAQQVNALLTVCEKKLQSSGDVEAVLSHPFISVLLATLAALLSSHKFRTASLRCSTMHLIPQFTILSKRMSAIFDAIRSAKYDRSSSSNVLNECSFPVEGRWKIRSSTVCGLKNLNQEYTTSFENSLFSDIVPFAGAALTEEAGGGSGKRSGEKDSFLPVRRLAGNGVKPFVLGAFRVVGNQYGSRVKYIEVLGDGNQILVEARLSLCGSYITGRYKEMKTGKMGFLEGSRLSPVDKLNPLFAHCGLLKVASLCIAAASKLSSDLIAGISSSTDSPGSSPPVVPSAAEDSMEVEDQAVADDTSIGSGSEAVDPATNEKTEQKSEYALMAHWLNSDLFSGGVAASESLNDYLFEQLVDYCRPTVCEMATKDITSAFEAVVCEWMEVVMPEPDAPEKIFPASYGCLGWWLGNTFPLLQSRISMRFSASEKAIIDDKAGGETSEEDLSEKDQEKVFYDNLVAGQGDGLILDEFMLLQSGQSNLVKFGGEPMQRARCMVLAAIIKHSGCYVLCQMESQYVTNEKRPKMERPNNILLDIWRATQRVVERIIRIKQETGASYATLCKGLCNKASLLLEIQPNRSCIAISDSLRLVGKDTLNPDWWLSDSGREMQQDCSKLSSDVVEFLISPMKSAEQLKTKLLQNSLSALLRNAGFRAIQMLLQQVDASPVTIGALPAINSLVLQSLPICSVIQALRELSYRDCRENLSSCASVSGHYMDGLAGVSPHLLIPLKTSFEAIYTYVAQHLTKCTWANDRDGQIIALAAWGIVIKPDDHVFLNHVGIFRVLQTVLDDARSSIFKLQKIAPFEYFQKAAGEFNTVDAELAIRLKTHPNGVFASDMHMSSHRRLAQLVLSIVHGLASQVASAKDSNLAASASSAPRLQKIQSGPDTLSKSLFDLMYVEFFTALKGLIAAADKKMSASLAAMDVESTDGHPDTPVPRSLKADSPTPMSVASAGESSTVEEFLDGENYVYRILKLLFLVSNSKVCQRLLSSPKWISLMIASICYGSLGIQRRILRLLRRLLTTADPQQVIAYVPSLLTHREDISMAESPLDDDVFVSLAEDQDEVQGAKPAATRIVSFFLEGVTVLYPTPESANDEISAAFLVYLHSKGTIEPLSADSLILLRVLQGYPAWRSIIHAELMEKLDVQMDDINDAQASTGKWLQIASALSVVGGYVERLRPGGLLMLKPFCLLGGSDNFATKIAAASHSCAMLVAHSNTAAEVVLMERGIKVQNANPATCLHSQDWAKDVIVHHTTSLAGSMPVRAVKLNITDVVPTADIQVMSGLLPAALTSHVVRVLERFALPWLQEALKVKEPERVDEAESKEDSSAAEPTSSDSLQEDVVPSNMKALQLLTNCFAFRALSNTVQSDSAAEKFLTEHATTFRDLVKLSVTSSDSGNLSVLEGLEDRLGRLWGLFFSKSLQMAAPSTPSQPAAPAAPTGPSQKLSADNESSSASTAESAAPRRGGLGGQMSPLRELAAMLSPFSAARSTPQVDTAAQTAAINQMLEMGLPREWCEFSLRRCHYNVEMAINLCFEHGQDMPQLIAEEAMHTAQQSSREALRQRMRETESRSSPRAERQERESSESGERTAAPRSAMDAHALVRQLLEMGFPPSWCARALSSSNNDLDSALGWILNHDDELVPATQPGEESKNRLKRQLRPAPDSEATAEDETPVDNISVLSMVSGNCDIKGDYTCSANGGGFPSVGCRGYAANSGKWYYELTVATAGCVQVGWVDQMYEGGADAGQGVGDDIHSWAYDGWRSYLWHEGCAEWGARWAPDDVVGCAIDLDSNTMSFFLNGYAEEVHMGLAFAGFTYSGGMYPCVSFNRHEKVKFNFGSAPFKHGPPTGYEPYVNHVLAVQKRSQQLMRSINTSEEEDWQNKLLLEDAFEESVNERSSLKAKRYFTADDVKNVSSDNITYFSSVSLFNSKTPSSKKELFDELQRIAKDLSILYARLIVLRSLNRVTAFPKAKQQTLIGNIVQESAHDAKEVSKKLIDLLHLSSVTSIRTRVHLGVSAVMPPGYPSPPNLGSVFCSGGAPTLNEIRESLGALVEYGRQHAGHVIDQLVQEVLHNTERAVERDFASMWRLEDSFSPVIFKEGILNDRDSKHYPSLTMAVWITFVVMENFMSALEQPVAAASDEDKFSRLKDWISKLLQSWLLALRSPSTVVKVCVMRMLAYISQEFISANERVVDILRTVIAQVFTKELLNRFERHALLKLSMEKATAPLYTEFLQALLEFSVTARNILLLESLTLKATGKPVDTVSTQEESVPFCEMKSEKSDPSLNWEAISGRAFTDDGGWKTWTGTVRVLKASNLPAANRMNAKTSERQEMPPELMPGCKVSRQIKVKIERPPSKATSLILPPSSEGRESSSDESGVRLSDQMMVDNDYSDEEHEQHDSEEPEEPIPEGQEQQQQPSSLFQLGRDATISRMKRLFELRGKGEGKADTPKPSKVEEFVDQIGTVVGIARWSPEELPGTAREIEWDDGTRETVRWGAQGGMFDVTHVAVKGGKITTRYSPPVPMVARVVGANFGLDCSYGVVFRLRKMGREDADDGEVVSRLAGIIEWPDFNAIVAASGVVFDDGRWTLTEERLLAGAQHCGWDARFGQSAWKPWTSFTLFPAKSCLDPTDPFNSVLIGEYACNVTAAGRSYNILGDVSLQNARLFFFDQKMRSTNIVLATDKLSISKNSSSGGQVCAFGNIGFSTGIHYWEFKVEQAELGSIFVGVSEKPDPKNGRFTRWMGAGITNSRASFRTSTQSLSERVSVYGDHFHTGDVIGVMLDLNAGRLSFFLDGLKYGEHILSDLGEAYENLCTPSSVKPKTYYPVVGLSKSMDRVTISGRWLSSVGSHPLEEYQLYNKSWLLLSSWSIERQTSLPFEEHMWIYREAWRNWLTWQQNKFIRIRSRCKPASLPVIIDISPRACVQASVRLGLPTALFSGDRILFFKSSGRTLDNAKEEAIILGAYNGMLWYRLDSQQHSNGSFAESGSLAWSLLPSDVEGFRLLRRYPHSGLPAEFVEFPLPRIPTFHGGFINLFHDTGAVVRGGLEIDNCEVMCTVPANTTLFALERRMNASNIYRYRVLHDGNYGWISERMRGGAEEVMLSRINSSTVEQKEAAIAHMQKEFERLNITDRVRWNDVPSLEAAMSAWDKEASDFGINPNPPAPQVSFEEYLEMASTMDGKRQWSVEADMRLVEVIGKCASREGITPSNLSVASLQQELLAEQIVENSLLRDLDVRKTIARAALLRVANLVFGHSLPWMGLTLPEEKLKADVTGSDADMDVIPTRVTEAHDSHPLMEHRKWQLERKISTLGDENYQPPFWEIKHWKPPCNARRLRSLRRLLFTQTKSHYWDSILDATSTVTPLPQDEYEDPKELKVLRINRVKATQSRLATISNSSERFKQSVFGQLHREIRAWSNSSFRRSYVGKGHGGQKRAFKVKFIGEGVNDYGGPYRAVFEQVVDELQCDTVMVGGRKVSERCLLPMLIPCPNKISTAGANHDKYLLATSNLSSPINQELMQFFGKLVGAAVRHNLNLALDLSSFVWRPFARLPVNRAHLESIDVLAVNSLKEITRVGLELEAQALADNRPLDLTFQPEEWEDLLFNTYLPDGNRVQLLPGGNEIPLNLGNWRDYVQLVEQTRLLESSCMFKVLRDGIGAVLPVELFPLFTSSELEHMVSGDSVVDINKIRQSTEYEDMAPSSALVENFWEVLSEMTNEEKTLFLRFVWARSRMPASANDLPMNFKLQGMTQGTVKDNPDHYLPHAQTCFFSLALPAYTSKDTMRKKLLYAIKNSPNMDADVRLHNAEGWADS